MNDCLLPSIVCSERYMIRQEMQDMKEHEFAMVRFLSARPSSKVKSNDHSNFLEIPYLNINSVRYKIELIQDLIKQKQPHILGIAETLLEPTSNSPLFKIEDYVFFRYDQDNLPTGHRLYIQGKDVVWSLVSGFISS